MTDAQESPRTDRKRWISLFCDGYRLGCSERKRDPEKRRSDVGKVIDGDVPEFELDAKQAGYDLGRKAGVPGAKVDVKKKANATYDKSGYATGLGDFV